MPFERLKQIGEYLQFATSAVARRAATIPVLVHDIFKPVTPVVAPIVTPATITSNAVSGNGHGSNGHGKRSISKDLVALDFVEISTALRRVRELVNLYA